MQPLGIKPLWYVRILMSNIIAVLLLTFINMPTMTICPNLAKVTKQ